jgi:CheY-like chemotaxis protein
VNYFVNTSLVNAQVSSEFARILVIDDEPLVTRTVFQYLQNAGYKDVHLVNDSREAIEAVATLLPDLILLDLLMPHVDGLELLEQISSDPKNVEVSVLVFSAADKGMKYKSIRLGAKGFVDKPVSKEELLESIEKALKAV